MTTCDLTCAIRAKGCRAYCLALIAERWCSA